MSVSKRLKKTKYYFTADNDRHKLLSILIRVDRIVNYE